VFEHSVICGHFQQTNYVYTEFFTKQFVTVIFVHNVCGVMSVCVETSETFDCIFVILGNCFSVGVISDERSTVVKHCVSSMFSCII